MRRGGNKIDISILVLILSVSAVVAYVYFSRIDKPNFEPRLELHGQIIAGTAPAPYRYRILVPFATEALMKPLSVILPAKEAFLLSYAIYDFAAVLFLLVVLFSWLKTWFSREHALIGVLFVAASMPVALQDHYFQPWSLLEAAIFSLALIAIHEKRYRLLFFLVAAGTLNRETAVFIPFAFLLTLDFSRLSAIGNKKDRAQVLLFGGLLLTWAAIYLGLRHFLGSAPHIETIEGLWARNTTARGLFYTVVNAGLFLGGFWAFALLGFRYAPPFVKRLSLIIPFYVATILLWGVWREVRLLMPLYPILVPMGLSFLQLRERKTNRQVSHAEDEGA